ncbi:MAG: sugar phosphate isomerase/epimerase [Nitrososphaerota archaeon]|nr:sugar phosphate isomerase/epimerase [Aigarchaeota archaeon]MDW8076840.1 sugar phosphate isomerase/epimerase [Nitrososphaerota archaeon]
MIPCVSTLSVHESPFGRILEWLKRLGAEVWEIIDEKPNELDVKKVESYKNAAPSNLTLINVHGPYNPLALGHVWFKRLEVTISLAGLLRSSYVVVHAPKFEDFEVTLKSLERLSSTASTFGINLLVENCTSNESSYLNTVEDFVTLFDTTCAKNLGLCLDVGHAYIEGEIDDFLSRLYEKLRNVHLHDNDGIRDLHMPLDAGRVPWRRILETLARKGYEGFVTLECKRGIEESLNKLDEVLAGFNIL